MLIMGSVFRSIRIMLFLSYRFRKMKNKYWVFNKWKILNKFIFGEASGSWMGEANSTLVVK